MARKLIERETVSSVLRNDTKARAYRVLPLPVRSADNLIVGMNRSIVRKIEEGATMAEIMEWIGICAQPILNERDRTGTTVARKAELDTVLAQYRIMWAQAKRAGRAVAPCRAGISASPAQRARAERAVRGARKVAISSLGRTAA